MSVLISPLAPGEFAELPALAGVRLSTVASGIRPGGGRDLLLVELPQTARVAGVLTTSQTASPPVRWCRAHLPAGRARALLVNSGNANTFTGKIGEQHVRISAQAVAEQLHCAPEEVLLASTGVIGETLPIERILTRLPALAEQLAGDPWLHAAQAIMTTDTYPKRAARSLNIGGQRVHINGIAKGSGMIAPNMATMLAFLFTDAKLPAAALRQMLKRECADTFNAITVDGDTSTSDTCLLFASGQGCAVTGSEDRARFARALGEVMHELALQIVRDGEGARKLVRVEVTGARRSDDARQIARCIANSPLVKTAIAGSDANWGRIVMAVGRAGVPIEPQRLAIKIGGHPVTSEGARCADYQEAPIAEHLQGSEVQIAVDLGLGKAQAHVYTCDLTHGYIDINADYRT